MSGHSLPPNIRLVALDTVDSTNEELKRLCAAGAPDGTLVWAREQTLGHGRRGRGWMSPRGNLYCSLLLRPREPASEAMQLSFVTALAVADTVSGEIADDAAVTCKWPNDVLVGGRKIAGILLESSAAADGRLDWLLIGVGLNIAHHPEGPDCLYPATSLHAAGASNAEPETALNRFCHHFFGWYRRRLEHGFAPIRASWLRRAQGLNERIAVRLERECLEGIFVDLNDDGALVLDQAGTARLVTAGEVFAAPPETATIKATGHAVGN